MTDYPYHSEQHPNSTPIDYGYDPAIAVTSLDPEESEQQRHGSHCPSAVEGQCLCSESFRHSGWKSTRHRVYAALQAAGASEGTLERFCTCGANAWVMQNPDNPGELRIACTRCKNRWCVPCANQRARLICDSLQRHVQNRQVRFLTLTIGGSGLPLTQMVDKLYKSFTKLRASKAWKAAVKGGVAILEVKPGKTLDRWHPHLHCIIEGTYIAQKVLSDLWRQITGDSYIVDIQFIRSKSGIARYVTKYVTKPLDNNLMRMHDKLVEAMQALKGRKIAATFGTWRGLQLTAPDTDCDWQPVAPLDELIHRSRAGDTWASAILEQLHRRQQPWTPTSPLPDPDQTGRAPPGEHRSQ